MEPRIEEVVLEDTAKPEDAVCKALGINPNEVQGLMLMFDAGHSCYVDVEFKPGIKGCICRKYATRRSLDAVSV